MRSLLRGMTPLALVFAGAAAAGCGGPKGPPKSPPQAKLEQIGLSLLLADQLEFAQIAAPRADLLAGDRATTEAMTSGWHPLETSPAGTASAWTNGRIAVIEVPRAETRDFTLAMNLGMFGLPRTLPPLSVAIAWNGEIQDTFPVVGMDVERKFAIPAGKQRLGPNRVEIMPSFWSSPATLGLGGDRRSYGVRCLGMRIEDDATTAGISAGAVTREGSAILQTAESAATFFLHAPLGARLAGELALSRPEAAGDGAAALRVRLAITTEDGRQRIALDAGPAEFAATPAIPIDVDLAEFGGQAIGVTVSAVAAGGGAPTVAARWADLRLEGVVETLARAETRPHPKRPNVLVTLFDALRADQTGPYGAQVQTPTLNRLAAEGTTFMNAYSTAPWTIPSAISLFASRHCAPFAVKVLGVPMGSDVLTFPEVLKSAGYRTAAVADSPQISRDTHFDRCFDVLHNINLDRMTREAKSRTPETASEILWSKYLQPIVESEDPSPFCVYLHILDPHSPYEPPPPYDTLYQPSYRGNLDALYGFPSINLYRQGFGWMGPADRQHLLALYQGEITYADKIFGLLLEKLSAAGKLDETLVIALADHGEEFGEHGRFVHGDSIYEEHLRIPMIMRLPGSVPAGRRPAYPVTLMDVGPTILGLAGVPAPPEFEGVSMMPFLQAPDDYSEPRVVGADLITNEYHKQSIRSGKWKLILTRAGGLDAWELYDLETDPREELNIWANEPIVGMALRQTLLRFFKGAGARQGAASPESRSPVNMSPEALERLRALGYIQ